MKRKIIIGLLAIVICFSLAGCGNKENPKEEEKDNKVSMNEKVEGVNLAVTFTNFETPTDDLGKGSYRLGSGSYEHTKDGYVHRLAHFTIENIGKTAVKPNLTAILNYGDGYTFNSVKTWYHVDEIYDSNGQKKEGGSWVNNTQELSPYDEPLEVIIDFMIPEEVANGSEQMTISFTFNEKTYIAIIK